MEMTRWLLPDTSAHFAQIIGALDLESGSPDFGLARDFWTALGVAIAPHRAETGPRIEVRLEEALVWRILARRMLRELGAGEVFQLRDKGAASGTRTAHPGIDALAKTYERLRRIMDELTPPADSADTGTATGLPMRMMKLLEETEGALEAALGLEPGEKCAFSPRLYRRQNEGDRDDTSS
jgi:hypothetical protein